MVKSILLTFGLAVAAASCWVDSAPAGQRYIDDFSQTAGVWRYGKCHQLGIKAIDSLCQWQNWRDGGDDNAWLINHWGATTEPGGR